MTVNKDEQFGHIPVLYQEVMELLQPQPGGRFIDGTVGAGGHARGLLAATAPHGRLLAFDRDPEALAFAGQQLAEFGDRVVLVNKSYAEMGRVAPELGFEKVDGILLDLGLSSRQLENAERGFSFLRDGPLDMRFDPAHGPTAAELVNNLSAEELSNVFWRYGDESQSRRIARLIVTHRPIETTGQLAGLIEGELKRPLGTAGRRHPATKVFQALRIAVNNELGNVEQGLEAAVEQLGIGGRLAVISFHSLEDRLVKRFLRDRSRDCVCPPEQPVCTCQGTATLELVQRKVIKAKDAEVVRNPRSRSARLRVATKLR